ncbi:MAG: inositol monophosphatase family protein, partial [Deltaproteobacteria bacterium]|nr:inositol monophosphatase family protein [Deltaproteobacteria bacterium]
PKKLKANFIVSIDAIDGTDLMVRSLSNWCTALFVFRPNDRVIVSLVGMHDGVIYYASEAGAKKSWIPKGEKSKKTKRLVIPQKNRVKRTKDASICFYGQKVDNFLSILSNRSFVKSIKSLIQFKKKNTRSIPLRIYNLGGNPMMIKLAEGKIDAVVEMKGQKLYDVIPGAFIATKAGAFWGDLNGNHINDAYLKKILANPSGKLSYILASTKKLYQELLRFLT